MRKSQPKHLDFPKALKSFLGYLEGTQKAAHTIKNYKFDLSAFHAYLSDRTHGRSVRYENLGEKDLEQYHEFLKTRGFKTNTRRRKLLTAHRFVRYLSQRKQLVVELPVKLLAPHKIERVPFTVSQKKLLEAIRQLPVETILEQRNRSILWVLAETGCLVSELTRMRYVDWSAEDGKPQLTIPGKAARTLPVSPELYQEVQALQKASSEKQWLFLGFNKHGSMGSPISSRGVELLVRHYSVQLEVSKLTPRTFRHSAVVSWFEQGMDRPQIQKRLGLKTDYAFRTYAPLFQPSQDSKSSSAATSTS